MKTHKVLLFLQLVTLIVGYGFTSYGGHGVSIDGKLKYSKDFTHFDYVAPNAVKGGELVLHDIGSFDKLNPFTLKGEAPLGIEALVFEPLAVSSLDEPFALYGLIAQEIVLAEDKKSVTFSLHPKAVFSDGSPILAEDVAYTLDILRSDLVHPYYKYYYQDIAGHEILGSKKIKVNFKKPNRELHMICAQISVLPKKLGDSGFWMTAKEKSKNTIQKIVRPLGSGPYTISEINLGKTITYQRNPDYWARDLPVRAGMYNYEKIVVKYFKDQIISLEAFKAGEFDFMSINIAKQWARDLSGKKFDQGMLIKKTFPHSNNAGMQGFVMNTRRAIFKDRKVRKALGLALDFEWINKSLFHNQYTRCESFFSNSYLAARGLPEGLELQYLEQFKKELPEEVFTKPLSSDNVSPKENMRKKLLEAKQLFKQAGWEVSEGVLKNKEGQPFEFDITLASPAFERVMAAYVKNLKRLGVKANYRTIDTALYMDRVKKFDFDMIVATYAQSQSPGNEQRSYWHSSTVNNIGTRNYAGVESPAVDALVDKIIYANTQQELTAACKALDRVLWYGYYVVPNWYLAVHRLTYSASFSQPEKLPLYYDPFLLLMTWWKSLE